WGRRTAVEPKAIEKLLQNKKSGDTAGISPKPMKSLQESIAWRGDFLVDYQNQAYAQRYLDFVEKVSRAEQSAFPEQDELTTAVAKYYFKLLAIKDEYEVARLYVDSGFLDNVKQNF